MRRLLKPLNVWHDTRLIVLVAQTAAVYAAILIPFKMGLPLIPGFSELRPANAVPVVASLLFGPVAAWGAGFGNLIGDCFGTLGPGSVFGFFGNFCYGYVPYLLWGRLGPLSSGKEPVPRSFSQTVELALVTLIAGVVCAFVVAWGVDLIGLLPFRILAPAIFFNNAVMGLLLAPPLLLFLYPRAKRWNLLYEDIMRREASGVSGDSSDSVLSAEPPHPSRLTPHAFLVEAHDVSFTYQGTDRPALNQLTFNCRSGEAIALMGRSGAGKSTLCYALNGLVPTLLPGRWHGRLSVAGLDTRQRPVWQQAGCVGIVFQDFESQIVSTSVERELAFPLEHLPIRLPWEESLARIASVLSQVGLSGLEQRNPHALSGGQRQRLVIGSTLVKDPALLVLDEPGTDLDPNGRQMLSELLRPLTDAGTAVVLAEHDPEEVVSADRLVILDQGRIVWDGPTRSFFARPDHESLATQFGIRPLPLATCFRDLAFSHLPLSLDEAWTAAADHNLECAEPPLSDPAPARGRPLVEVERMSFAYQPGCPVLSDVNLTVREGEFLALLGCNGSGKSTLAALVSGLKPPSEGRVLVGGRDTRQVTVGDRAALVGVVYQNPDHQIFAETVEEEVSFAPRNLGYSRAIVRERVAAALDAVGLGAPGIRRLDPFSLTKGERQRVAVASILAARPRLLIFDEPTTGLDARETERMMGMIERLNRAGHTILMITHALGLAASYAHRCIVLHKGGVALDGPTRGVFRALLDAEQADRFGLVAPTVTRFAGKWGVVLLTPAEVRASLRRKG
jgi:energy-coupling factor transporter ATP-binding protein EcfA2